MTLKRATRGIALVTALLTALHFPCAAACDISDQARYAAYRPFLQMAIDETTSVYKKNDNYSFNAASDELVRKNAPLLKVGDAHAVRLLIGLGLLPLKPPGRRLLTSPSLACEAAKRGLAPRNVSDPLTCAVIALYRSRDSAVNRTLAKEMFGLAKSNLASDPDPGDARHRLEIVAPIIENCAS